MNGEVQREELLVAPVARRKRMVGEKGESEPRKQANEDVEAESGRYNNETRSKKVLLIGYIDNVARRGRAC